MSRQTEKKDSRASDAVARAHGVVELLRASADRIEAARALPADVVAALNEARLFRLMLPKSLGGDELNLKTLAQVIEVIAGAGVPAKVPCVAVRTEPAEVAPVTFGASVLRAWSRSSVVVPGLTCSQPERRPP